ncbi:NosD domain-containing protein [Bosea sp. UC22_33]|uniref:NosD domain-containing protein n=1 Tax=Bosea sp. UC22_33 TaxID=3350165 RepID=UPI0036725E04
MNWRTVSLPALLMVGMASFSALGQPAERLATPATLSSMLKAASGGETIVLAPGDYGAMQFPQKAYSPAIRIQAQQANFTGLILASLSGVTIDGGTIVGPGGRSYGVSIREARNIRIANMTISGAHRGIVVNQGEDVALVGNRLTELISDGINVAYSRRVRIERNSCRDFRPTPAVYDAAGNRLKDGDHADCIQAWSRPAFPPTSDLTIIDNEADGLMQGIFLGNHVRDGIDDGGFDRVVIRGNRVRVGVPNGITVSGLRQGEVIDNVVDTTPGATLPKPPHRPVRAKLMVLGTDVVQCGNRVVDMPNLPGQTPCQ